MENTIKEELLNHILDRINNGVITNENKDEHHFHCFNEDYYIIGYFEAEQWLKKHDVSPFEAIGICQEYEEDNYGGLSKVYNNAAVTVNALVYIYSKDVFSSFKYETVEDLEEQIKKQLG